MPRGLADGELFPSPLAGRGAGGEGNLRARMSIPVDRARQLRQDQTRAERAAWSLLRNGQRRGFKFRRQQPIDGFVVDFCCFELRLIIELDGSVHAQPSRTRRDRARDRELQGQGFKVLHFPNGLVLRSTEGFVEKVEAVIASLDSLTPCPSPAKGGRGEGPSWLVAVAVGRLEFIIPRQRAKGYGYSTEELLY